jgi:DNA-directed RNA polymerase
MRAAKPYPSPRAAKLPLLLNLEVTLHMNLTSTQARIDAQHELEHYSMELGIAAYRKTLEKDGTTATTAGQRLLRAAMEPMIEALNKWLEETGAGLASRSAGVYHFINGMDPDCGGVDDRPRGAAHAARAPRPGPRVRPRWPSSWRRRSTWTPSARKNPRLAAKMAKQAAAMASGRNRAVFIRKGADLVDVKVIQWDDSTRARVGTLLLHHVRRVTGLVAIETIPAGGKTTPSCAPPRAAAVARGGPRALRAAVAGPHADGLPAARLDEPVQRRLPVAGAAPAAREDPQPRLPHDAEGARHAVGLRQRQRAAGHRVGRQHGRLRGRAALWENGPRPRACRAARRRPAGEVLGEGTEPEPDVLHAWKVDAARTYEANAKLESKRLQLVQKLWVAELMMERGNRFHYVYNLDWRGRMYPVGPALTPQGDDLAKGLLQFAHGVPLGDDGAYWLAIHGANSFGVDKVSFEERIEWVEANDEPADPRVRRRPAPCSATMLVGEADSPFVFLAFCFEYAALQAHVNAGNAAGDFVSHLPVAFDGSCNGLQNFSAMLRIRWAARPRASCRARSRRTSTARWRRRPSRSSTGRGGGGTWWPSGGSAR